MPTVEWKASQLLSRQTPISMQPPRLSLPMSGPRPLGLVSLENKPPCPTGLGRTCAGQAWGSGPVHIPSLLGLSGGLLAGFSLVFFSLALLSQVWLLCLLSTFYTVMSHLSHFLPRFICGPFSFISCLFLSLLIQGLVQSWSLRVVTDQNWMQFKKNFFLSVNSRPVILLSSTENALRSSWVWGVALSKECNIPSFTAENLLKQILPGFVLSPVPTSAACHHASGPVLKWNVPLWNQWLGINENHWRERCLCISSVAELLPGRSAEHLSVSLFLEAPASKKKLSSACVLY